MQKKIFCITKINETNWTDKYNEFKIPEVVVENAMEILQETTKKNLRNQANYHYKL